MLVKRYAQRYLVFDIDRCYRLLTSIKRFTVTPLSYTVETKEI
jgi:hypothetical protein